MYENICRRGHSHIRKGGAFTCPTSQVFKISPAHQVADGAGPPPVGCPNNEEKLDVNGEPT